MNPPSDELNSKEFETGKDYHSWSEGSNSKDNVQPNRRTRQRQYEQSLQDFLKEPDAIKAKVRQKRRASSQAEKVHDILRTGLPQLAPATPGEAEADSESLSQ
eukprot:TRINITY_DN87861_c0_g1_i1.p1 TRINITY_DN87861_c0_g1~~TRINITY_DN87861_c0_g1_i1.p1  ORF type:complete len:103 (+),score=16.33 TRINITY_DN87861_c0_g1_i1:182-490(+)